MIHWLFSSHVFVFSAVLTVDFLSHSIVVGKDAWYFNFLKFIEAHSVAQHVISPRECFLCTWEECVVFFLWLIHWSLCSILCLLTVFCFKLYFVLWVLIRWLSFDFHLHGIPFYVPSLSVCLCHYIWSGSLIDSIYKGLFKNIYFKIYLAVSSLSCSMQDLELKYVGFLVVAYKL